MTIVIIVVLIVGLGRATIILPMGTQIYILLIKKVIVVCRSALPRSAVLPPPFRAQKKKSNCVAAEGSNLGSIEQNV
jgi:hypothetical protein